MVVDERKLAASALGGKTARACDGCLRRRARWFCPADDAFLCQACDASVHSANQLASRHERVRLETSSKALVLKGSGGGGGLPMSPAWHQGFTRKARTPRHGKSSKSMKGIGERMFMNPLPLVPEMGSEEEGMISSSTMVVDNESEEDRFPFRVPVFDPFNEEELGDILTSKDPEMEVGSEEGNAILERYYRQEEDDDHHQIIGLEDFPGFQLPSDMDLAKFAADVEHLLGSEFDDDEEESPRNKDMGFTDFEGATGGKLACVEKGVKVKDEAITDRQFDQLFTDQYWNFDFEIPVLDEEAGGEDAEEEKVVPMEGIIGGQSKAVKKKSMLLRLNYEAVISAWAGQASPWTTGRPHQLISPNHCLPICTGTCPKVAHQPYGGLTGCRSGGGVDEGREARVLRYKEKRRNRLFSKKIRYEVRKLNAEKRPRMKGRFVKRSSFNVIGTANFPYLSFSSK